MLNTIIAIIALFLGTNEGAEKVSANVEESTITWSASKVTGSHQGTVALKSGSLEFEDDKLVGGNFVIDMATIACTDLEGEWKGKLEGHLKSDDFFGVEKYKTSSLNITKVVHKGADKYEVTGDFSIKNKTASVTFPVQVDAATKVASANIILDRTEFDVRYGSNSFFDNLGDKAIHDNFTLNVKLVTE